MEQDKTPISTQKLPKPKNWLLIGVFAVAVAAIGVDIYLFLQNKQLRQQTAQVQEERDITAIPGSTAIKNWDTYNFEALNFSISYPQDWTIESQEENWSTNTYVLAGYSPETKKDVSGRPIEGDAAFQILLLDKNEYSYNDLVDTSNSSYSSIVKEDYLVDSSKGILFTVKGEDSRLSRKQLIIEKVNYIYLIEIIWGEDKPEKESVLDQILLTFRFLGQTDENVCTQDSDCVVAIQITDNCCPCPKAINQQQIDQNGWEIYEQGTDYSSRLPSSCRQVSCEPCQFPTNPVCINNTCQFSD